MANEPQVMSYPIFAPGQRLIHSDLNKFINFFAAGQENTRLFLTGRGIVYGLELNYDNETYELTIGRGAGLSSDGDLFGLEMAEVFNAVYEKPIRVTINGREVDAFELYPKVKTPNGTKPDPQKFRELMNDADQVVLLYIAQRETRREDCLQSADNTPREKFISVKGIIVNKEIFTNKNWTGDYENSIEIGELAAPFIHRPGYTAEGNERISYESFTSWSAITGNLNTLCASAEVNIETVYKQLYDLYSTGPGPDLNPFENLAKRLQTKRDQVNAASRYGILYFYDYLRDLVAAAYELLNTDIAKAGSYWPKRSAFPEYISLGCPANNADKEHRMDFYRVPISLSENNLFESVKSLMDRMIALSKVEKIFLTNPIEKIEPAITPSPELNVSLSRRPIPFYLEKNSELINDWNYEWRIRKRMEQLMGIEDKKDRQAILRDINIYDFFKVKGLAGRPLKDAQKDLERLREELHLPFDIEVLFLGDEKNELQLMGEKQAWFSDLISMLLGIYASVVCDNLCGGRFVEIVFGPNPGKPILIFEHMVEYFDKAPDPENNDEWLKWATETCIDICDSKSACCPAYLRALYQLTKEYSRRKAELLDSLLFHRFAKTHPGIEHQAGVFKGGTIYLVCEPLDRQNETAAEILYLMQKDSAMQEATRMAILDRLGYMIVAADFCLPYVCCSKLPSVKVELIQEIPLAKYEEVKRGEIVDDNEIIGYRIMLGNRSKNADSFKWTLFDSKDKMLKEQTTQNMDDVEFELLFADDNNFSVVLIAERGGVNSTFKSSFSIETVEIRKSRPEGYNETVENLKTVDTNISRVKWYKDAVTFLKHKPGKKNLEKEFDSLLNLVQSEYDTIKTDERKKAALEIIENSLFFLLDSFIENKIAAPPAEKAKTLTSAKDFIKKYGQNVNLVERWKADEIQTDENKKLIDSYNAILA